MSRSYRKHPIVKDNGKSKRYLRRLANRRVRRKLKDIDYNIRPKSNDHRRLTESWEICDWVSRYSEEQARCYYYSQIAQAQLSDWHAEVAQKFLEEYPTLHVWLNEWRKQILRK